MKMYLLKNKFYYSVSFRSAVRNKNDMGVHFRNFLPILIVVTTTTSALTASNNRVGFGDACSKTIKCKSQSWLVCNSNTSQCDCAKLGEMIYDTVREKCVVIIGERCLFGFGFDDESLMGPLYEKLDCVNGAICDSSDGICSCPIGTYEAPEENKCLPMKHLGDMCQSTTECNYTLTCSNGQCDCGAENMEFDSTSGTCRIKAGEFCSLFVEGFIGCISGSLQMCSRQVFEFW